jgi:hypothetical protein
MPWSLSKLKTYEQCPAKYKYQHIDKLATPQGAAAARGTAIHQDIELFLLGTTPSLPDSLSIYHSWLTGLKGKEMYPEHKVGLGKDWTPIEFDSPDVWLRSVLDLKVLDGNEAYVYDWKTGKVYPDHVDQKTLYTITTFAEHPNLTQVTAMHVYVDLGKNTQVTYHRDQAEQMKQLWQMRINRLEGDTSFLPRPDYGCRWCQFSRAKGGPCRF